MRAVVTGATSGIGEALARRLAQEGNTVVLVGRDDDRIARARDRILQAVPDADLRIEKADFSLLQEVRELADRLAQDPPDIVVSNAAVIADPEQTTDDGIQRALAVNHLAPYLLLRKLIEPIGDKPARFVVIGAEPRNLRKLPVDLDDLQGQKGIPGLPGMRPLLSYGRTKNMNAMFVYALARRLEGTRITVNGVHPGVIRGTGHLGIPRRPTLVLFGLFMYASRGTGNVDAGADTPAWLATSAEVEGVTGRFFVKREQVETAPHTTDVERCDRLWAESARLVGLPE